MPEPVLPELESVKIVFDSHLDLRLPPGTTGIAVDSGDFSAACVREASVLVVRSVTRVDRDLLQGSSVRLVVSATTGTDHIDSEWLDANDIELQTAAGVNARAVAEYTLVSVLLLAREHGLTPTGLNVAIVGFGRIGKQLYRLLSVIGARISVCDPFVACDSPPGQLAGCPPIDGHWCTYEQALKADVISFHTPLTFDGDHPTHHLLRQETLAHLPAHSCIINAARGGVHHSADLLEWAKAHPRQLCLDVYEGEPNIDLKLPKLCLSATAHVAGYTHQARAGLNTLLNRQIAEWARLKAPATPENASTADANVSTAASDATRGSDLRIAPGLDLLAALLQCTNTIQDGERFLAAMQGAQPAQSAHTFTRHRREYLNTNGGRHEFSAWTYRPDDKRAPVLEKLGFRLAGVSETADDPTHPQPQPPSSTP